MSRATRPQSPTRSVRRRRCSCSCCCSLRPTACCSNCCWTCCTTPPSSKTRTRCPPSTWRSCLLRMSSGPDMYDSPPAFRGGASVGNTGAAWGHTWTQYRVELVCPLSCPVLLQMNAVDLKDNLDKLNNSMAFLIKHSHKLFKVIIHTHKHTRSHSLTLSLICCVVCASGSRLSAWLCQTSLQWGQKPASQCKNKSLRNFIIIQNTVE